jgi:hypothetical protein
MKAHVLLFVFLCCHGFYGLPILLFSVLLRNERAITSKHISDDLDAKKKERNYTHKFGDTHSYTSKTDVSFLVIKIHSFLIHDLSPNL